MKLNVSLYTYYWSIDHVTIYKMTLRLLRRSLSVLRPTSASTEPISASPDVGVFFFNDMMFVHVAND